VAAAGAFGVVGAGHARERLTARAGVPG
jgi:hypothetical protein